jgi:hypothetical protein
MSRLWSCLALLIRNKMPFFIHPERYAQNSRSHQESKKCWKIIIFFYNKKDHVVVPRL